MDALKKLKQFVPWNKWTLKALKCKTEKDFRELCWQCFQETAKEGRKDWKDISLEDLYRALQAVRKKTPGILRKITLKQALDFKDNVIKASDLFQLIYGILQAPVILAYLGAKKIFGKRVDFAFKIYIIKTIVSALYKSPAEPAEPAKKSSKK